MESEQMLVRLIVYCIDKRLHRAAHIFSSFLAAGISTHIENIQKRNYVSLQSGRRLYPSKLGLVLVQGYHRIDSSLVLPQVRSDIEDQCNMIAKGLATKEEVVERAIKLFREKYNVFVSNIDKMDVLFGTSFSKLEDICKPFTRCGFTRRYLQFIAGPPARLYNNWTESVYPLPAGGVVKQWTGRLCPVVGCNFELSMYETGHPARTFPLCPRCCNDPEWALDTSDLPIDPADRADAAMEDFIKRATIAGKALVLECPLPDRHPLIEELTVSPDPESNGVLILDPHLGPKWRLVSTRAPTVVHLPKCIDKVTVLEERDDILGVRKLRVDFKPDESPMPDKSLKHVCCFASDETLQSLSRVFHGSKRLQAQPRGRRNAGRGGRGGQRGRGRGRL
jgi:DNA topoisomerase-3